MYFQSLEMLSNLSPTHRYGNRLLTTTIRTVKRCHEGQALDLGARADVMMQSDIYDTAMAISRLKTGGLTALAAWMGAISAGANKTTREAITRFGGQVGVCLQMHNDLSELTKFVNGCAASDDLRNARVTWPWAWAARRLDEKDFLNLQTRYAEALGNQQGLLTIAKELFGVSARHGGEVLVGKLDKHLRLLAEHVESLGLIKEMELALAPLKRNFDANAR
jgi:geranylgeranyl pyrophosphate synthase